MIHYFSTRDSAKKKYSFSQVVLKGLAFDGGLFVPEKVPSFSLEQWKALEDKNYQQRAVQIIKWWETDLEDDEINRVVSKAYEKFYSSEVTPIVEVEGVAFVLELWHGPTAAFKDLALQMMPLFFSLAVDKDNEKRKREDLPSLNYLILVATSGDTGKAALEGFRDKKNTQIMVYYPFGGVSQIQALQMQTQEGENIGVYGIEGNFDDAQRLVKSVFTHESFCQELENKFGIRFSSANSINWGRILPQIIYYLNAYVELIKREQIAWGEKIDVVVPTGNFGNILSAYYAKQMGIPLGKLLCASNENNILADFIQTGVYDLRERSLIKTPSPSMDILVSSNMERFLYHLTEDSERIKNYFSALKEKKFFKGDKNIYAQMKDFVKGDFVTNERCLEKIVQVWQDNNYLMDPHTAVAYEVGSRYLSLQDSNNPLLVVSTAHWSKFGTDVYRALGMKGKPGDDFTKLKEIEKLTGKNIHPSLTILADKEIRFPEFLEASEGAVKDSIKKMLED